ncbi:class I SAM-dependent methyltransferase [Patescibacteria group bacterium]
MKPKKQSKQSKWYAEQSGFFGQTYLDTYKHLFTKTRTIEEVNFIEKVLKLKNGLSVLDLACGHGRHAILLAHRGYKITGQDLNSFFLKKAEKEALRNNVKIKWIKGDMRKIIFRNEFDIVLDLFTAFGYLENDAEDLKVLQQVAKALKPGGKFFLDIINREWIIRNFEATKKEKLPNGITVTHYREFDLEKSRHHEHRIIIFKDKKRKSLDIYLRLYTLTELIQMCKKVGLSFVEAYGDYNGKKYSFDSKRTILIVKKDKRK